jgi:hypothetical protein
MQVSVSKMSARARAFSSEACPGLDPGWTPVRGKKTRQNKKLEPPFRFNRNGKGSRDEGRKGLDAIYENQE